MVAPRLEDRERLWTRSLGLDHISRTSTELLREALRFATTDDWGYAPNLTGRDRSPSKSDLLTADDDLKFLAAKIRKRYGMQNVWVVRPRAPGVDANSRVAVAAACFLEGRGGRTRSLAISTGRTVEHAIGSLDADSFSKTVSLFSTVLLLHGDGGFRDSSSLVDMLAARFDIGKSRSHVFRLGGLKDNAVAEAMKEPLRTLAESLVESALNADVIFGSVRPWNWFGSDGDSPARIRGRTQPFDRLFSGTVAARERAFREAGVVAIHQMIPLNERGEDMQAQLQDRLGGMQAEVYRPSIDRLREAASNSRQLVLVAASHRNKTAGVRAMAQAGLCSALVIDNEIAQQLLD